MTLPCCPESYAASVTFSILANIFKMNHILLFFIESINIVVGPVNHCMTDDMDNCEGLQMELSLVYEVDVRTPHLVGRNPQNFNVVIFLWDP